MSVPRARALARLRQTLLVAAVGLLAAQPVSAQNVRPRVTIASPPSPVGAGARATGSGSAFVAVADDATAASWNPAGLIQLERPELSVVGLVTHQIDRHGRIDETTEIDERTVAAETDTTTAASVNYLSAALPFAWRGRNIVVSLNYQEKLSFDRTFDIDLTVTRPGATRHFDRRVEQSGRLYAFSPAAAVELSPGLSIGAALNYWFDGIGRERAWRTREVEILTRIDEGEPPETLPAIPTTETYSNFRGVNGTFGLLWRVLPELSFGARLDLPFKGRFRFRRVLVTESTTFDDSGDLEMFLPLTVGAGLAWRPSDRFTLSGDVTYVPWEDFRVTEASGTEFLITSDEAGTAQVDGVTTVRVGAEHVWVLDQALLAARAGAFYDPEPSRGSPHDFYGGSLGLGLTFPDVSIDVAYQLRFGLNVKQVGELDQLFDVSTGELDTFRNSFYVALVYYL